jgi:hypothetical protein
MSFKLFAKSALLMKTTSTGISYKLCNGYVAAESEAEAKGQYFDYLRKEFNEYSVQEMLFMEIPSTVFTCDKCNPVGDKKE